MQPTVVLVHGAFAESSSWNDVVDTQLDNGHLVVAGATRSAAYARTLPLSPIWSGASAGRWCWSGTPKAAP